MAETPRPQSEADPRKRAPKSDQELAEQRADSLAAAQIDPGAAARIEALEPAPVYHLPGQAEKNPGVQGFVFRPHQEPNPGEVELTEPYRGPKLAEQVRLEKDARARHWTKARDAARARGETVPDERPGPARLRMNVNVSAHSVIDEDKLAAVAQAADALVAAIREAGVDAKADVSGIPF